MGLRHPERLVGLHFFNPVPAMSLIFLVLGTIFLGLALAFLGFTLTRRVRVTG